MSECVTSEGRPKVRYESRAAAKAAARQVAVEHGDAEQRPYRCGGCGFFHLGHYPVSERARAGLRERHRLPLHKGWTP